MAHSTATGSAAQRSSRFPVTRPSGQRHAQISLLIVLHILIRQIDFLWLRAWRRHGVPCRELWYRASLAWQHILASPAPSPLVVAHNAVNQVQGLLMHRRRNEPDVYLNMTIFVLSLPGGC